MENEAQPHQETAQAPVKKSPFVFTCPDFKSAATWGRFMIALSFLYFGYSHIAYLGYFQSFVPSFLPVPLAWVIISGVLFLASSMLLIVNIYVKEAATTIFTLFTLITILVFSVEFEPTEVYLYIALLGGLLLLRAEDADTINC